MKHHGLLPLLALAFALASCGGGGTGTTIDVTAPAFPANTLNLVAGAIGVAGPFRGVDVATGEPAARTLGTMVSVIGMPGGSSVVRSHSDDNHAVLARVQLNGIVARTSPAPWEAVRTGCADPLGNPVACAAIDLGIAAGSSGRVYGLQRDPAQPNALLYRFGTDIMSIPVPGVLPLLMNLPAPMPMAADALGNLYVFDETLAVRKVAPDNSGALVAGGGTGNLDGQGAAARFAQPRGMAIDAVGNLYVTDDHAVRKITRSGVVATVAGVAGTPGAADGSGPAARFNHPEGIAVDARGNLYVADTGNRAVRRITPAGEVSTVVGQLAGPFQLTTGALPASLRTPRSVAIIAKGLLITDDKALLLATLPLD